MLPMGQIYFFMNSPLMDLGNYRDIFDSFPRMYKIQTSGSLDKPYDCRWEIINEHIYLVNFTSRQVNEWHGTDENGVIGEHRREPTSYEVLQQNLQTFTNRKFDAKKRMKADWLNGKYKLSSVQQNFQQGETEERRKQHQDSLLNKQHYFLAHFKKGKLLKIEETDKNWKVLKNKK